MVGAYGYVAAHRRKREAHGSTPLNFGAFEAVGIVARPDLRAIIQHAGVESAAAARAALYHYVGESRGKPRCEVVHA